MSSHVLSCVVYSDIKTFYVALKYKLMVSAVLNSSQKLVFLFALPVDC